jgi:PKHD-type hydroxylase
MYSDKIKSYLYYNDFLSEEEIERIFKNCNNSLFESNLNNNIINQNHRKSLNKTLEIDQKHEWFFEKLMSYVYDANLNYFGFDISGISEEIQLINYCRESDHVEWHYDRAIDSPIRKLTCIVQLSDPDEYEGCSLLIKSSFIDEDLPKDKGTLIIFPSFMLHKVTPLISGNRWSLTAWITGPPFI